MDVVESRLSYREHSWTVHRPSRDRRGPELRPADWRIVCDSDSEYARRYAGVPHRFFFDFELLAAGLDTNLGGHLSVLTEPWGKHQPGALVMTVYEPDNTEIGVRVTYCVADDVLFQGGQQ